MHVARDVCNYFGRARLAWLVVELSMVVTCKTIILR